MFFSPRIHGEGEANEQAALWGLQIDFLRIVSSHEHFIPLNLPQVIPNPCVCCTLLYHSTGQVGGRALPHQLLLCALWTPPHLAFQHFLVTAGLKHRNYYFLTAGKILRLIQPSDTKSCQN